MHDNPPLLGHDKIQTTWHSAGDSDSFQSDHHGVSNYISKTNLGLSSDPRGHGEGSYSCDCMVYAASITDHPQLNAAIGSLVKQFSVPAPSLANNNIMNVSSYVCDDTEAFLEYGARPKQNEFHNLSAEESFVISKKDELNHFKRDMQKVVNKQMSNSEKVDNDNCNVLCDALYVGKETISCQPSPMKNEDPYDEDRTSFHQGLDASSDPIPKLLKTRNFSLPISLPNSSVLFKTEINYPLSFPISVNYTHDNGNCISITNTSETHQKNKISLNDLESAMQKQKAPSTSISITSLKETDRTDVIMSCKAGLDSLEYENETRVKDHFDQNDKKSDIEAKDNSDEEFKTEEQGLDIKEQDGRLEAEKEKEEKKDCKKKREQERKRKMPRRTSSSSLTEPIQVQGCQP